MAPARAATLAASRLLKFFKQEELKALIEGGAGIEELSIERPGLHDAFVAIAGEAAAREMASSAEAELEKVRTRLVTNELVGRQTPQGKAEAVGWAIILHGDPRAADREIADLQAVTAADVQRVLRRHVIDRPRITVTYTDEGVAQPAGDDADHALEHQPTPAAPFMRAAPGEGEVERTVDDRVDPKDRSDREQRGPGSGEGEDGEQDRRDAAQHYRPPAIRNYAGYPIVFDRVDDWHDRSP